MGKSGEFEKLSFPNRSCFVGFLNHYFRQISEIDEMMLFAHQVNDWRTTLYSNNPDEKVMNILKSGLSGSSYGSTDGTLTRMGSTVNDKTIDKILDYDYHSYSKGNSGINCYPTVVLAFPKFINVTGEMVEFATSKYSVRSVVAVEKLNDLYNKFGENFTTYPQYAPKTWLDIINGFKDYSAHDNLMVFKQDDKGIYHVILPRTHWLYLGKEEYERYKQTLSLKIIEKGADLDIALVNKAKECSKIIDSYLDEI